MNMLQELCGIIVRASRAVMDIYDSNELKTTEKSDGTPLTLADTTSDQILSDALSSLASGYILSEERIVPFKDRRSWKQFWMIDPLDGTKDFIARTGEFTINVALIQDGRPVIGVIAAPGLGEGYCAEVGKGACKFRLTGGEFRPIRNTRSETPLIGVQSRFHNSQEESAFFQKLCITKIRQVGSSLKMCLVAEGLADVYPRFGPTREWDTAAAHCILSEANGKIVSMKTGRELEYNKEELTNDNFLVCRKDLNL
jgi:3'(2'), 5'-bisphosphate nucleotidase